LEAARNNQSDDRPIAAAFRDRREAGRELGERLLDLADRPGLLVLGLPKGGVPVAFEVARALQAPLDALVVRKRGFPGHEELAIGAIASGDVRVINEDLVRSAALSDEQIAVVAADAQRDLERQERELRDGAPPPEVEGRTVLLVDDGLATGATMRAAIAALRARGAGAIVVAVPTASPEACASLSWEADDVVCSRTPEPFRAVGEWYEDFAEVTDEEVRRLLEKART
jgi:putative phosphoribosyl transferase